MSNFPSKTSSAIEIYYFGLDYIRFNIGHGFDKDIFEQFAYGLSDNSNRRHGVDFLGFQFDILFLETDNKIILLFEYFGDVVFQFIKLKNPGAIANVAFIFDFYSTFFYVEGVHAALARFVDAYREDISVGRVDIAFDTSLQVQTLWDAVVTKFKAKSKWWGTDGQLETFYLGNSTYNKKHFIRVYDKKRDSTSKNKFHIFWPYAQLECVTRIEAQYNVLSCKAFGLTPEFLLKVPLMGDVYTVFPSSSPLWPAFATACVNPEGTMFSPYESLGEGKADIMPAWRAVKSDKVLDALPYAQRGLAYFKKLYEDGWDVHRYLREKLPPIGQPKALNIHTGYSAQEYDLPF